jgi:hypothetical protein
MNKTGIYNLKLIVRTGRAVTEDVTEALLGAQSFTREQVAKRLLDCLHFIIIILCLFSRVRTYLPIVLYEYEGI